jgi:hypothetical protein
MNPPDIIIDRNETQKAIRVDALRAELKALGYSVVLTSYLAALAFQAKRLKKMEDA